MYSRLPKQSRFVMLENLKAMLAAQADFFNVVLDKDSVPGAAGPIFLSKAEGSCRLWYMVGFVGD